MSYAQSKWPCITATHHWSVNPGVKIWLESLQSVYLNTLLSHNKSSCLFNSHTCDQLPPTQCAGHGTRLQGLVVSGLTPTRHRSGSTMCRHGGSLLSVWLWTQNTWRSCMPREPQVEVHCSHSAGTHTKSQLWNGSHNPLSGNMTAVCYSRVDPLV